MFSEILNLIKEYDTIIIHRHKRPDPDALGSQGGLEKALKHTFPNKNIFVVGEMAKGLEFLNTMDVIEDSVFKGALSIVLDTANEERISDQRYTLAEKVIKIDHHPEREFFGDVSWVDTNYSSASEMIYEFIRSSQEIELNEEASFLIFAGIIGDTGRFLYNNTSSKTHLYVSELLNYQFDPQVLYDELYKTNRNVAKLHGIILSDFSITENGVAYFKITKNILNQYDVSISEASNLVNVMANIVGNHIWVLFIEDTKSIRARIRSKKIAINGTAETYGGGGHPLASGAEVSSWEEADSLIYDLNKRII